MGNIFKFYRQKLTIDNSYSLLYVKFFFIKSANFARSKEKVLNVRQRFPYITWDGTS